MNINVIFFDKQGINENYVMGTFMNDKNLTSEWPGGGDTHL